MKKSLLKMYEGFFEESLPYIECPYCKEDFLIIDKSGLQQVSSIESIISEQKGNWIPPDEYGYFTGVLACRSRECSAQLIIGGNYEWIDSSSTLNPIGEFEAFFKIRYLNPYLPISSHDLPKSTPKTVRNILKEVDSVIWTDPNSAANRLRLAIEEVLTLYGMRRFVIRNSKRERLSTHTRLKEFLKYETGPAEAFMAVKWIGNQGSHDSQLKFKDILDGIEIMKYGLEALYGEFTPEIEKRIARINKRKKI